MTEAEMTYKVRITKIIAYASVVCAASMFGSCSFNNYADSQAIVELVKAGASPIEARCSVRPDGRSPECSILAAKK